MVDARLQDGSRVNAVIPPLALDGPVLSIRRFRTDRIGAQDLVERMSLTQPMLDFLKGAVAARLNIIVSGGTGAGKTTLLNALSSFISERERIVTIEDAAELTLRQRHVVRLETRPANIEGQGAVRQRQLVVNALRMRPDRIIVGEVRGEEALDMLQAMNTGHDGSLTTIHANSPRDALYRLDTMVAMANLNIPDRAVRQQIASAVNMLVQISRMADGTRKVTAISEITGMEQDVITMQDIFLFERTGHEPAKARSSAGSARPASGRSAPRSSRRWASSCRSTCSSTCSRSPEGTDVMTFVVGTFVLVVGDRLRAVLAASSSARTPSSSSALSKRLKRPTAKSVIDGGPAEGEGAAERRRRVRSRAWQHGPGHGPDAADDRAVRAATSRSARSCSRLRAPRAWPTSP